MNLLTHKSDVFHKRLVELSRFTKCFFHAENLCNNFGFDSQSTLLRLKYWGIISLVISWIFEEKFRLKKNPRKYGQKQPKTRAFILFVSLIFAGNVLKQKLIMLFILLYKFYNKFLFLSYSKKDFLPIRLRDSLMIFTPDGMTKSHRFFACRQITRIEK